jgi:methyl-accepting chemotaxis protein
LIIFTAFLSFYLAEGVTKPVEQLRAGAEIIGKGNLDYQIKLKTGDEIEELAKSFNRMAEDLKKSRASLEETKTVLEIKVAARTRELRELAENLDGQVKQRTKELREKVRELERFNRLAVGRELKMIELKKEIERLKEELEKYKPA